MRSPSPGEASPRVAIAGARPYPPRMSTTAAHPPLVELAWSVDDRPRRIARNLVLVLAGSALLTLAAKLRVPFVPVPLTLQDFAVLLIAMSFGWRLGTATVLAYLGQGALGLPVFAGTPELGSGIAYMLGPTGGYLLGFAGAAALVGWLAERGFDRRPATAALAMAAGLGLILACGASWLARFMPVEEVLAVGLLPFLPAALLKIALATGLFPSVRRALMRT